MRLAKRVFAIAGVYGLLALLPMYALEGWIGRDQPPAITHPEYFYGFLGVAVAWQVAFLIMARDPGRFRPLMIPAVLEKAAYGIAVLILFVGGRITGLILISGLMDLLLALLFLIAFLRTAPDPGARP